MMAMKVKIAICDDEQNQIESITSIVTSWSTRQGHSCEIHTFASAEAFLFEYGDGTQKYVLKQIHHEPCAYYQFGDKIRAEINDYNRLKEIGIRICICRSISI